MMKTTLFFKQLFFKQLRAYLSALFILFTLHVAAQNTWPTGNEKGSTTQVTVNKTIFNCRVGTIMEGLFISNSKFADPLKGRKEHSSRYDESSIIKLASHDSVVLAIRGTFTETRMAQLIAAEELLGITIYIDEKGEIIKLNYSLDTNTSILPTEIEVLEEKLLEALRFIIEGKIYDIPAFYVVTINIDFNEVLKGEMRRVRNLEIDGAE